MPNKLDYQLFNWTKEYLTNVLISQFSTSSLLNEAIKKIDRKDFVPEEDKNLAYQDKEIDIGYGQKILKPTQTIYMLNLLDINIGDKILDIGTGSGYSVALMAHMVGPTGHVFSLENNQYILDFAKKNLKKYPSLKNISLFFRNGLKGLAQEAPFDIIHVSAPVEKINDLLKEQLALAGKLLVPTTDMKLHLFKKVSKEKIKEQIFPEFIPDKLIDDLF